MLAAVLTVNAATFCQLDVKHDTSMFVNVPQCDLSLLVYILHAGTAFMVIVQFVVVWCNNIGLVSLILLGLELPSYITVLCVQGILTLSLLIIMPSLYSHPKLKNFYIYLSPLIFKLI